MFDLSYLLKSKLNIVMTFLLDIYRVGLGSISL